MKLISISIFGILILLCSCHEQTSTITENTNDTTTNIKIIPAIPDSTTKITGDFNGDGKKENAWVVNPALNQDSSSCKGDCNIQIHFSDTTMPIVSIQNAINGELNLLGDLNQDGKDEFGILPGNFTGCWNEYHVYTWHVNDWIEAVNSFPVHCIQWGDHFPPVSKDSTRKGYAKIYYSVNTEDGIRIKTKSVPLK